METKSVPLALLEAAIIAMYRITLRANDECSFCDAVFVEDAEGTEGETKHDDNCPYERLRAFIYHEEVAQPNTQEAPNAR